MIQKQCKQEEELRRMREELLRKIGPPTHFTTEEAIAAITKLRDERLRRETEKRRSRRK